MYFHFVTDGHSQPKHRDLENFFNSIGSIILFSEHTRDEKTHLHCIYESPYDDHFYRKVKKVFDGTYQNKHLNTEQYKLNALIYAGKYLMGTQNKYILNEQKYRNELLLENAHEPYKVFDEAEHSDDETGKPINSKRVPKSKKLLEYCMKNGITERTAFDTCPYEEIQDFITMPGINNALASIFQLVSAQLLNKHLYLGGSLSNLDKSEHLHDGKPFRIVQYLQEVQEFSEKQILFFGRALLDVVNKKSQKKNCFWIWGPASAGKTAFLESLVSLYFPASSGQPVNNPRTTFRWGNCINKRILLWEEPQISPDNHEELKKVLGGQEITAEVKYQSNVKMQKTPVLITSNRAPIYVLNAMASGEMQAWEDRCFIFNFSNRNTMDGFFPLTKNDWESFGYYLFKYQTDSKVTEEELDINNNNKKIKI